jgi:hypothetical protein
LAYPSFRWTVLLREGIASKSLSVMFSSALKSESASASVAILNV